MKTNYFTVEGGNIICSYTKINGYSILQCTEKEYLLFLQYNRI